MASNLTKIVLMLFLLLVAGCKTKDDVLREKQMKQLSYELRQTRAAQANSEQLKQELQMELTRMSSLVEAQGQRIDRLEQNLASGAYQAQAPAARPRSGPATRTAPTREKPPPSTYAAGKAYFDKGQYVRAMATLKRFLATGSRKSPNREKAQFLLAECYFANKDYALAALEYNKFKRNHPSSKSLPTAIYRQAVAFRNMGKKTEAKLFYQELIDRFPRHSLTKKAKREIKGVR